MLEPGKYMTRNSRIVELREPFARTKPRPGAEDVHVSGFKGVLLKADGRTEDSSHEWENTGLPNTLGVFYQPHAVEGQASQFDLIQRI